MLPLGGENGNDELHEKSELFSGLNWVQGACKDVMNQLMQAPGMLK